MALDGTLAGMQASISDFLNRTDLTTATLNDLILATEAQMNRRLRVRAMVANVTTSATSEFITQPLDFAGPLSMQALVGGGTVDLDQRQPDDIARLKQVDPAGQGDTPDSFAVVGQTFQLWPAPAASPGTTILLTYFQKIPSLVANPTGNWLSIAFPDAYLYGALAQAAPYLAIQDGRAQFWPQLYGQILDDIEQDSLQTIFGARITPFPAFTQIV